MYEKQNIQALLETIEDSLFDELNIDNLARAGYVSLMQLYRDFYNMVGHTVKEYIRKRRLSCALSLVAHSDLCLASIAHKCGYGSQQAFCKSVKKATGQTPLEYKISCNYYYFPAFSRNNKRQVVVASEKIPNTLKLKYYNNHIMGIENCAVKYLISVLPEYRGRIFGRNGKQVGNKFCYELYIEKTDSIVEALKSSNFKVFDNIPESICVYAKTRCENIEDEIIKAWNYIYTDWLKTSMFEQSNDPYFEEYIIKDGRIRSLLLFLPVCRRKGYSKIRFENCGEMLFIVSRKKGRNAEDSASQEVLDYLSSCYPDLLRKESKFIVSSNDSEYICGVSIDKPVLVPENGSLEILRMTAGEYVVLEEDSYGSSDVYDNILRSWAHDMGFKSEDDDNLCFTVYEANGKSRAEDYKIKVYLALKK